MKTTRSIVVGSILLVLAVSGVWIWLRLQNRLVLVNESGQDVSSVEITTGGKTYKFEKIPNGQTVSCTFAIRGDDGFALNGKLADGTGFALTDGYVTNGDYGQEAVFTIRPGGEVKFRQKR